MTTEKATKPTALKNELESGPKETKS